MTPEEKAGIRLNLIDYITGTVDEWLRLAHFGQTSEDHEGVQYRISWEHPTGGAMIASVSETRYNEPLARFGVQVDVDILPDLPPIGPEDDLGIHGIAEEPEPKWLPATFADCLPGDRMRAGGQETDVLRASTGQWHAKNREWIDEKGKTRDHQKRWDHVELRMDLSANPGFQQYPPGAPCEILCDPDREASLLMQQQFPGSAVVDQTTADRVE